MSGRDIQRAYYLKDLLDRQIERTGSKEAGEERLDRLLGPSWRNEIEPDGLEIADNVDNTYAPEETDPETFYDKVRQAGQDSGMGWQHSDYDEEADGVREPKKDGSLRGMLQEILARLHGK